MIWLYSLNFALGCAEGTCPEACRHVERVAGRCSSEELSQQGFSGPEEVRSLCEAFVFEQRVLGASARPTCANLLTIRVGACSELLAFDWDAALAGDRPR